jgi:hypothetical protein
MPTRKTYLAATLNGVALTKLHSAFCTYSWKLNDGIPTATVYMKAPPGPQLYDQTLNLTMGAGNNVLRFVGLLRGYSYALWPVAVGLTFQGRLVRALEFQNHDDPLHVGGLTLLDLLGTPTGTDQAIVAAVLSRASVSGVGTINGTGATFGTRAPSTTFLWRAGTSTNPLTPMAGAGQTALGYGQEWDKASAVYTSNTAPLGFYRTYETVNGIRRALIGGRPRSTVDFTFSEGVDIEMRARSERLYPIANAAFVTGYDPGLGIGAMRNQAFDSASGGNTGVFLGQSSNPFQPSNRPVTKDYGSPFIEWGAESEAGIGMNAERVGNAVLPDWNRETVLAHFRTSRDMLLTPGMTILVQGAGGQPQRLGIGEPLWVDTVTTGIAEDGEFYQDIDATGGGLPDAYTPPPLP